MNRGRLLVSLSLAIVLAVPCAPRARERSPLEDWFDDSARWLSTRDEAKAWKRLKGDEERERFVALFWARRDPTRGTARNEFRDEYERRLAYADDHFGSARDAGRETDRGRVYCLLGPPSRVSTFALKGEGGRGAAGEVGSSGAPTSIGGGVRGALPPILWTYEDLPADYGLPTLEVRFVDYEGFGSYALDAGGPAASALKKAVELVIVQPDLKEPPVLPVDEPPASAPAPAVPAPVVAEPTPAPAIATAAIRDLLARSDPAAGATLKMAFEAVMLAGSDGHPMVFLAFGPVTRGEGTAFYRVSDAGGVLDEAEAPTMDIATRTLRLPPGTHRLEIGMWSEAKGSYGYRSEDLTVPVWMPGRLALSSVLITNATETLPSPAAEAEPFTFGQVKLIPRLPKVLARADELMIFLEAYGVRDGEGGGPRLLASFAFDKEGKFWNEIPEAPQAAVRLAPGRYLLTQVVPLARFAPAKYRLRVTVKDGVAEAEATGETTFQVK